MVLSAIRRLLRRFGRLLPAAQQLLQGLRVFMTTIDGGLQPATGDGVVLFDTVTVVVQAGEVVLGFGVALLRGLFKPMGGTCRIFFYALAVVIHDAEIGLRFGMVVHGGLLVKAQRFGIILAATQTIMAGEGRLIKLFIALVIGNGGGAVLGVALGALRASANSSFWREAMSPC